MAAAATRSWRNGVARRKYGENRRKHQARRKTSVDWHHRRSGVSQLKMTSAAKINLEEMALSKKGARDGGGSSVAALAQRQYGSKRKA